MEPTLYCEPENMLALEAFTTIVWENVRDINLDMRRILVDWLTEVHKMFKLFPQTLSLTVIILDRYLGVSSERENDLPRTKFQLYGMVSLMLASKILEIYPPETNDFVFIADNQYTAEEIHRTEEVIFKTLEGRLNSTNHINFDRVLSHHSNASQKTHSLTNLISIIALRSTASLYPASVVSTASHIMAHKINCQTPHNYFGVDLIVLECCIQNILQDITSLKSSEHLKVFSKDVDFVWFISVCKTYPDASCFIQELKCTPIHKPTLLRKGLKFIQKGEMFKLAKLGEGSYGKVSKVSIDKTSYACKKIGSWQDGNEGLNASFLRESSGLTLEHENIVTLHGFVGFNSLLLEFMDMDLKRYYGMCKLTVPLIVNICDQLLEGLCFLESVGVMHRDIKPQNILVRISGNEIKLKYADFGSVRGFALPITNGTFTHEICTLWYRPPEIMLGEKFYSHKVDVWSLGCVLHEVCTKKPLFPGDSEIDQLYRIFRILGTPTEATWNGVCELPEYKPTFPKWEPRDLWGGCGHMPSKIKDMISLALTQNPSARPTAKYLKKLIN